MKLLAVLLISLSCFSAFAGGSGVERIEKDDLRPFDLFIDNLDNLENADRGYYAWNVREWYYMMARSVDRAEDLFMGCNKDKDQDYYECSIGIVDGSVNVLRFKVKENLEEFYSNVVEIFIAG